MSLKPRPVNFKETWAGLKLTIQGVVTLSKVNRSEWNDRFSDVYSLCVAYPEPYTTQLYEETENFLKQHVRALLDEIIKESESSKLLRSYHEMWNKYSQGVKYLNQLYLYMNQQHAKKSKTTEADLIYGLAICGNVGDRKVEIGELGLDIWKTEMLQKIQTNLIELVLESIKDDRRGTSSVSTAVLNGVVNSFVDVESAKLRAPGDPSNQMTFYEKSFETPFLQDTGHFYQQEANNLIASCTVSEYMTKVITKLHEEDMRARRYLHPSSYSKLSTEVHKRLVADHLPMLHAECSGLVQGDKRKELADLYCLLKPIQAGLLILAETFETYVKSIGLEALNTLKPESPHIDFVENLIVVYKKFKDIVTVVFNSDQLFLSALDKACTFFINHRKLSSTPGQKGPCRSPELIARYCDVLLKKSTKGYSESEVDEKLSDSVIIFKYVDDKDVFQKFYSRNLARRLIHSLSHSMDSEEGMINRLKQACGYEFTNKLHRMFTDVSLSQDLCAKFNEFLATNSYELGLSFSMLVLQAGAWPLQQNASPFALPQVFEKSVKTFEEFYSKQFNGRKLTWLHHLSACDVKVHMKKKTYLITMQTCQVALLLPFETMEQVSFQDLALASHLTDDQLERYITSLVECKLLEIVEGTGTAGTTEYTPTTMFTLNREYANKRSKFRISAAVQKETPQEVEQAHVSVEEDRKIYLQAAIVRIMKSRKVIKHNLLMQEVLSMSDGRFCPTVSLIKKSIETLIERQYLERTPNSNDEYSYVA